MILPNQATPTAAVETFLKAMRVLDGEAVWSAMSQGLKDMLTKEFDEMKKGKELNDFIEEFNAPYLKDCHDPHQFTVMLFKAVREACPDKCADYAAKLSDSKIREFLDGARLEEKGSRAVMKMKDLGSVELVKEGPNWKVDKLDDFDIFDF